MSADGLRPSAGRLGGGEAGADETPSQEQPLPSPSGPQAQPAVALRSASPWLANAPPRPLQAREGANSRDDAKRAFDEAILERLVALNAERAAEEARGLVRWLRPAFQNPNAGAAQASSKPEQAGLDVDSPDDIDHTASKAALALKPQPWPKDAVDQVRAVADLLSASQVPLSQDDIAAGFTARGPWKKRLPQLLLILVALGRVHEQEDGRYAADR